MHEMLPIVGVFSRLRLYTIIRLKGKWDTVTIKGEADMGHVEYA